MPGLLKPRKDNPTRSKTIRRKMKGEERTLLAQESKIGKDLSDLPLDNEVPFEKPSEVIPTEESHEKNTLKKIREGLIVEQTVTFNPGKGKPIVEMRFRLTTAVRGKKKQDNLQTEAHLLRLEILNASEGVVVEGLILGPWQIKGVTLEPGSIYIAEPLWTGFQSVQEICQGRIYLGDTVRNRLLDLPIKVNVLLPGPETFSV